MAATACFYACPDGKLDKECVAASLPLLDQVAEYWAFDTPGTAPNFGYFRFKTTATLLEAAAALDVQQHPQLASQELLLSCLTLAEQILVALEKPMAHAAAGNEYGFMRAGTKKHFSFLACSLRRSLRAAKMLAQHHSGLPREAGMATLRLALLRRWPAMGNHTATQPSECVWAMRKAKLHGAPDRVEQQSHGWHTVHNHCCSSRRRRWHAAGWQHD